jgi:hypothetical protein
MEVNQNQEVVPAPFRTPLVEPGHTFGSVTDKISSIVLTRKTPLGWFIAFSISFTLLMMFMVAVSYLLIRGVGIWGINVPIAWGFAIVNFVWWIGIGHAGTLSRPSCCYCGNRGGIRSTGLPKP